MIYSKQTIFSKIKYYQNHPIRKGQSKKVLINAQKQEKEWILRIIEISKYEKRKKKSKQIERNGKRKAKEYRKRGLKIVKTENRETKNGRIDMKTEHK